MSINHLLNKMREQAQQVIGQKTFTKVGTITSYNQNLYAAKVMLQPEQIETTWLPILSCWVGNQWGLFTPPSANDVVIVHFFDGFFESGAISLCNFNNVNKPLAVNSGEFWLVHQSGSYLKFTNDGNIAVNANENLNITINNSNNGAVNITGPVNITGALGVSGAITSGANITDYKDSMEDMRTLYNEHVHGASPTPTPQMPA